MDINLYHQCPCHPEKKIKFCCGKDVIGGLSEAMTKAQADQPAAALDTINRLISKEGDRDCLLTMKSRLLLSLNKIDESEQANEQFLTRNPGHFLGLQQRVALAVGRHDSRHAFEYLQDAIDAVTGSTIPLSFAKTFEQVGALLATTGFRLPAREHFLVSLRFQPDNDESQQAVVALSQLQRAYSVLARRFVLPVPPETDAAWLKKYQNVLRAYNRGQFRKAMQILDKALELAPSEPILIEAKACLSTCLPDLKATHTAFQNVARHESFSIYKRIEFETVAQFINPDPGPLLEETNVSFDVDELDNAYRNASSNDCLVEVNPAEIGFPDDAPRPRYCFVQLNRPRLKPGQTWDVKALPNIVGFACLYGRQTDRKPRVDWIGIRDRFFDESLTVLKSALSLPDSPTNIEVIGRIREQDHYQQLRLHLPEDTSPDRAEQARLDSLTNFYQNVWPNLAIAELGNRKPSEVFGNKDYEISLRSLLMRFEIENEGKPNAEVRAANLAQLMGLEPTPIRALTESDVDFTAPVATMFYGTLEQIPSRQLMIILQTFMNFAVFAPIQRATKLLLERPGLQELGTSRASLLAIQASLEPDLSKALAALAEARREAKAEGQLIGQYLVSELQMRLSRFSFAGIESLIHEISQNHFSEPEVEERTFAILSGHGLLARDGSILIPTEQAAKSSGLWTPDNDPGESGDGEKPAASKLWVPGT